MTNLRLARAAAVTGFGLAVMGSAMAAPQCPETLDPQANYKCVFIDVGAKGTGDGKTGGFYELGLTGTLATSVYTAGLAPGSAVIDTNRASVLAGLGFPASGVFDSVQKILNAGVGPNVGFSNSPSAGQRNVDSLNPLATGLDDTEGFNSTNGWALTFDYLFTGTLTAGGPQFTGGDIRFFYTDLATNAVQQILRVDVTGSNLNLANLDILGKVSFDFNNDGNQTNDCTTAFCQAFWNFQTGPENWFDLIGSGVELSFALDTNVNPPFPSLDQLTPGSDPSNAYWLRQTTLDSSIRFNEIPEPGSLALVGMALLGLAGVAARRSRKS